MYVTARRHRPVESARHRDRSGNSRGGCGGCALACVRLAVVALLATALAGCDGDDGDGEQTCLDPLPACDQPSVPPTFDRLYDAVFSSCGSTATGSSCHSEAGHMNGLILQGEDNAYAHLLGDADGHERVVPGSPECSLLVQRLESDDPNFVMPVGSPLPEGLRCSVRMWIEAGAERTP